MTNDLEELLRRELQPRQAPDGFVDRVMRRQARARFPYQRIPWPAIAAVLLFSFAGGGAYWKHQRDERALGEHARSQVLLALHITGATFTDVHRKLTKGEAE